LSGTSVVGILNCPAEHARTSRFGIDRKVNAHPKDPFLACVRTVTIRHKRIISQPSAVFLDSPHGSDAGGVLVVVPTQ
jgi:hypothetical protein